MEVPDELAIFLPGILENCSPWGISPGRYHLLQSQREKAKVIVLPVESKYAESARYSPDLEVYCISNSHLRSPYVKWVCILLPWLLPSF